ncbi:ABC_ATPase domain containing protein [uncultured Caudovirales phage]|uniref:ABC_ATPase domain containing protein n=1 Tax=uncultured Caudovirales phage TaxID=2100421 RepID=A0A6J5RHU6_9CAUD|nr:ABC_ATPase domain containing protein [uncultured Caudovirales phage]
MKLVRLYINNFLCHDKSFIDFTQFSSALIVGKQENSDMHSNGVGKTSIFKSIEYVLFNQADIILERIIREDQDYCQIVLDFFIGTQEYRVSRKRTKKGSTDLSLFIKKSTVGSDDEVYHNDLFDPITDDKFWKDISCRRAADTERELDKLIKTNYKAFRSTQHFVQNDMTGLATATPEKRKGILKDALNLIIYSKLEKIAKDKSAAIYKDIEKYKVLIENLGDPNSELLELNKQLVNAKTDLDKKIDIDLELAKNLASINTSLQLLNANYSSLENKFSSLIIKEKELLSDKNKLEISIKEYQSKKNNSARLAKELISEVSLLQIEQAKLAEINFYQNDIYTESLSKAKEKVTHLNIIIQNNSLKYDELKIPVPDDSVCKHCRQNLTEQHKILCKSKIDNEIKECQSNIQDSKKEIIQLNKEIVTLQQSINSLNISKQQLENINTKITTKGKEIQDKRTIYEEYSSILDKFNNELLLKIKELDLILLEIKASSLEEATLIKDKINNEKENISNIESKILLNNKDVAHLRATIAVLTHSIDQKNKDNNKLIELKKAIIDLQSKYNIYPIVQQAFSSVGIPNIIIQNVLDDLQSEANILLSQLKPGLQLAFSIEKTVEKTGDQADTLDINYFINNKERYFAQLSGAQQLAVAFSLKLGLSFVLNKINGTDIKFLLLDEIDQPLDKASVDAFADIVKFFQKYYTILVITHNDRLKDKFSHAICVEQDSNLISKAKVVSSW